MKVFNIFFCLIFIVFAALQYNDPDPYLWVPIYMYTSVLCWLAVRKRYFTKAYLLGITVYALYAVYKVFDTNGLLDWLNLHHAESIAKTMKAEQPWIEESREFFGLIILIAVLSVNYFVAIKKRHPGASK
jgi:Transmembrane family 220, helix